MDNNIPSEQRELNENFEAAPQPIISSQPIEIQINQQGNSSQQGSPPQQQNPPQQRNEPQPRNELQQRNISQQGNPPQQEYQPQQENRPQQRIQLQLQQGYQLQYNNQPQQIFQPQQGYGQPILVVPPNPNSILVNQAIPENSINFGRAPISLVCTHCGENVTTVIEENCNGAACCFCCVSLFCIYACFQCSRGKDLYCTDSTHICPKCRQIIGTYSAIY